MERTLEIITREHNQLCFRVGQLQYMTRVHSDEIEQSLVKIQELNQEADKVIEAEKLKKKEELAVEPIASVSTDTENASEVAHVS